MFSPSSLRRLVLAASMVVSMAAPLATQAAVPSDTLIKGATNSAVYYVDGGKRYAFPNEKVFKSWYPDFSSVVTVQDTELAGYTLAGNVTYRPGTVLVKISTDPKVYAVSHYGVLRWIVTESAAATLYGANWNTNVHDIADTFFTNYLLGSNIGAASDYTLTEELAIASISQNIRPLGYTPPTTPSVPSPTPTPGPVAAASVTVGISTSQATLNQMVTVFAVVSNNTHPIATLEVFNDQQSASLATCTRSTTCSFTYTVKQAPLIARFFAVATDDLGVVIKTPFDQQGVLNVQAVSSDIQMSAMPLEITAGSRSSFTSDAMKFGEITSHRVYATINGEPSGILWKDCGAEKFCASSTPFYRTTQLYSEVVTGDQIYRSAAVTVTVTSGSPPKPSLALTARPAPNQATLVLSAPSGETIGWSTIVEGTTPDDRAIALCEFSSCEITVQFTKATTFTGFTDVGGKLEASNSVTISP